MSGGDRPRFGWLEALLGGLIVAAVALELRLVFTLNVNWDEFHYLSRVYEARRGALPQLLQTFHVHLFGWLPAVGGHEMRQVFAARTVLFGLGLGSRALVFAIARRFVGPAAALVAVLAWSSFSYVLHHGASFRFDPMLAFLSLAAVALLLGGTRRAARAALAGLAVGLSFMLSLKTAFQLPSFAAALALGAARPDGWRARLAPAAAFGATAAATFAGLYGLHAALVGRTADGGDTGAFVGRVATSFLAGELLPRAAHLVQSLEWDAPFWLLLAAGVALAASRAARGRGPERARAAVLLAFALPLASIAVYRNAFPYFYVLVLAPAVVLCALPVDAWLARSSPSAGARRAVVAVAALLVFSTAVRFGFAHRSDETLAQAELIDLVHELFPAPTPYIDRCGMIATYPKVGMFISKWGLDDYRAAGRPVMEDLIRTQRPPFVIANVAALNVAPEMIAKTPERDRLLDADRDAIREHYIWHWSKLAVAGKSFAFAAGEGARAFRILIPGTYTVESKTPVRIDGELRAPRSLVRLGPGAHSIASPVTPARVSLRWGERLRRPQRAPVDQSIFTGFLYDE